MGLAVSGVGMALFAVCENPYVICSFGFLFFAALPFANNSLDYLVRTNIPSELQGRAWGFLGFISQLGYVAAYGLSGITADLIGKVSGKGVGAGSAITIIGAGIYLVIVAIVMSRIKKIRELENVEETVQVQTETA